MSCTSVRGGDWQVDQGLGKARRRRVGGGGSGYTVHLAFKLQTKKRKKKGKGREGGGRRSLLSGSAEKEETEAQRGRFWRGKREMRAL